MEKTIINRASLLVLVLIFFFINSCKKEELDHLPVLTTSDVKEISFYTAEGGGIITSDGGLTITYRGICWSTDKTPTISNTKTMDGNGIGVFISSLTELTPNTTYYARAYATNATGTQYGNTFSFTTLKPTLPTVTTTNISNIKQITASCGGNITSDGGSVITTRGVCWSTTPNPAVLDNKTLDGTGNGIFISSLSNLNAKTLYYLRAYATNSYGTAYGNAYTFSTLESTLPTLTTYNVTDITITTAACGGSIIFDGGSPIISRGVCWSISPYPTIDDNKTSDGDGDGFFSSQVDGLTANGKWYVVRAYAINKNGISYGPRSGFRTLELPVIFTSTITDVKFNSAISGGWGLYDGGSPIISKGVCWSITENPTVDINTKTIDGSGTVGFVSSIAGLEINNKYYLRAYATNIVGTSYGDNLILSTGIGAFYQGGIIAYILQPGDPGYIIGETHGLIVSPFDQSSNSEWGCKGVVLPGADGSLIGTGMQNTIDIVTGCPTNGIAAKLCYDLELNGYADWFLPSKDELSKIMINHYIIGIPSYDYWSSTEITEDFASLNNGLSYSIYKNWGNSVRAIRVF